jgi:hypothetical protein
LPSELLKKFRKAYNDSCKAKEVPPLKPLLKIVDDAADDKQLPTRLVLNVEGMGIN